MATYTTKSGDMWDSIAYKQLGSMSYADRLINANLQHKDTYLFPLRCGADPAGNREAHQ